MRSTPELYERSLSILTEGVLMCVLTDCFSPQELVKLLNKVAAPRPGFRPGSIPTVEIALDALDFYIDDPGAAHSMITALNKKTDALARDIARTQAGELSSHYPLKAIRGMMQDFTIGRFVWALLRDERPEADELLKKVLAQMGKRPRGGKPLRKIPAKIPERRQRQRVWVSPAGEPFEEKVKKSKEFLDEIAGEYRALYHQVKRSQEKERKAHEEIKSARKDLEEALREKNVLSGKCRELESRLHALETQPVLGFDIEQKLKRIAKEKEKLEYEVAKMRKERESELQKWQALEQKSRGLEGERDELAREMGEVRQRESSLRQKIGALEKELGSLKARAKAVPKQEHQKKREYWEQRVGIFVDGLTCYASARALYGKKVDYRGLLEKVLDMRIRNISVVYLLEADFPRLESLRQVLRSQGFLVKPMKLRWENEVTMDIMNNIDRLDTVVTCTGRPPSLRFREALEKTGKRIECYAFERGENSAPDGNEDDISYLGEDVLLSV